TAIVKAAAQPLLPGVRSRFYERVCAYLNEEGDLGAGRQPRLPLGSGRIPRGPRRATRDRRLRADRCKRYSSFSSMQVPATRCSCISSSILSASVSVLNSYPPYALRRTSSPRAQQASLIRSSVRGTQIMYFVVIRISFLGNVSRGLVMNVAVPTT